jgi:hypothetical protein
MNKPLSFFLLAIIIIYFLGFFFFEGLLVTSINLFTDYKIAYDKEKGCIFRGSELRGLRIKTGGNKFGLLAEKALFNLRVGQSLKEGRLILDCDMQGVKFASKEKKKPEASFEDNILAIPFSPEQEYKEITFTVLANKKTLEILDFDAYSPDVQMRGDCIFFKNKDDISLNLKISFSPKISATFPDDVKGGVLSLDEGGWYSTVISYKGNVMMLRALYSLTK